MRIAPINKFNYSSSLGKDSCRYQNTGAVNFKKGRECTYFFGALIGSITGFCAAGRTAAATGDINIQTAIVSVILGALLGGFIGHKIDNDADGNNDGFSATA